MAKPLTNPIPTSEEINVYDSLDERSACEHFLGKNLDEAECLFREGSNHVFDLMWMGPVAFRYYVQAIIRYVQSEGAKGDCETVLFLVSVLEVRIQDEPEEVAPVAEQLTVACDHILEHLADFDADDQRVRYEALRQILRHLAP